MGDPLITIWKAFLIKSGNVTFSLRTVSAASEQKNFDEESIASLSTSAQNETRDGFCPDDLAETSALQALHDRNYGFSFWPKVNTSQHGQIKIIQSSFNNSKPILLQSRSELELVVE